jgi:predicted RNase H-like HicB family nuclease
MVTYRSVPNSIFASQGDSVEQARENLREALALFFECASPQEAQRRLRSEVYVTQVEVAGLGCPFSPARRSVQF